MKNININFGGFYNSFHSQNIDFHIEQEEEYFLNEYENKSKCIEYLKENDIEFWELYDHKKTYANYSKLYIESFNEWLKVGFKLDLNIVFKSLSSPKYYNHSTDIIIVNTKPIKKLELDRLINNELLNDEFNIYELFTEKLHKITTSCSGYIAFYNYNDVFNMIDKAHKALFLSTFLDCLIDCFNPDFIHESNHELITKSLEADEHYKDFFNI